MIGVGAQDDFAEAQNFLDRTGMAVDSEVTMLWEQSGWAWRMNGVEVNSQMQLYSHDFSDGSGLLFFNKDMRAEVLDAAGGPPWSVEERS